MARTVLPPGFRFHPTDIELIMYHLKRKVMGKKSQFEAISELNIYRFAPWDLPDKSCLKSKDLNWYFFCPREKKYATGDRMRRGTETGFWKATGKDRSIMYKGRCVGMVKTLVFHEGCPPKGKRTDWVVYEYRMSDQDLVDAGVVQDAYVLYKLFKKNGPGPKNGAQYGAPFDEEEWDNDDSGIPVDSLPSDGHSPPMLIVPENPNSVALKRVLDPVCTSVLSLDAGPSTVQPSSDKVIVDGPDNSMVTDMFDPRSISGRTFTEQCTSSAGLSADDIPPSPNDDIAHLLAAFTEDGTVCPNEENYELDDLGHGRENVPVTHLNGSDPCIGLEDLNAWADELNWGVNLPGGQVHNISNMPSQDDMAYLELNDLDAPLNFSVDPGGFENICTGSSYVAHNPDASEQILTGISSTQYCSGADMGVCYNVNFPGSLIPGLSQFSLLPDSSSGHFDSTNVNQMENALGNILNQGYTAGYNLHSFSYGQQEESRDASRNLERASKEVA